MIIESIKKYEEIKVLDGDFYYTFVRDHQGIWKWDGVSVDRYKAIELEEEYQKFRKRGKAL